LVINQLKVYDLLLLTKMLCEFSLLWWMVDPKMNTPLLGHLDMQPLHCGFNYLIKPRYVLPVLMLFGSLQLTTCAAFAQETATFQQKLRRQVSVTWQGQQLAAALQRLARAGQIPLWLDRRVDRQQEISIQLVEVSLAEAMNHITQQQALGFLPLKNIAYGGPQQSAQELPALIRQAREQLRGASAKYRKRWLREESVQWPRLTEPRALVELWLRDAEIELIGIDRIAHDLLPEQELPPLALVDRLVLVLSGFDLTCAIRADGRSCEIVPIRRPQNRPRQGTLPKRSPGDGAKRKSTSKAKSKTSQRFTLKLENQRLGNVLDQLEEQLGLEVAWSTSEQVGGREQLVSFEVQEVELDQLLRSLLAPLGLQHSRDGNRVRIEAKR
jgi:hypothetical protein